MGQNIHLVNVFTSNGRGGNLAPILMDARGLTDLEMRDVARRYERESSFVLPAPKGSDVDFELRFFVPEHEMEMCGHATVGTAWVMHSLGMTDKKEVKFVTKSGTVRTRREEANDQSLVFVSQPKGTVEAIQNEALVAEILSVLGINSTQLGGPWPVQNACTSRLKTMVPLKNVEILNNLQPDFTRVKDICEKLGSTGLYPYTIVPGTENPVQIEARQFPKASGYPEDAATGIAAAALSYALASNGVVPPGREVLVHQGRAMGYPSEIKVQLVDDGCWVGGSCTLDTR